MPTLLNHLGSQVLRRSTIRKPAIIVIEVVGPSEIGQLYDSVHVEQDVFGLDVPVDDGWVQRVKILHRGNALAQVLRGNFLAEAALFFEQGVDLALSTVLQN